MDFSKVRHYLFLGFLGLITVAFLIVIKVFAYPLFWAAVLAGLFYPVYRRLNAKLKHANLSTTITLSLIVVIILVPLAIVATLVIHQSLGLYGTWSGGGGFRSALGQTTQFLQRQPIFSTVNLTDGYWAAKISEVMQKLLGYIFSNLKEVTEHSLKFLFYFITMLYALFFFIRDGEKILKKLMYLSPLGDKYEQLLFQKFTSTVRAALKGTLVVGLVQGTLGGILFALTGIPGAALWGVLMVMLALIPGVGAAVIWLPTGLLMLLLGHWGAGVTILLVGALIISTIDNILRPILIGNDLQLHPVLILFSTLGGIAVFGISGFIIGPIIAALFMSFWELYEQYYRNELARN